MNTEDGHIKQLVQERDRLKNAVDHLQRSQRELAECIEEQGDEDRTFKTAIEENIVAIAKYLGQIEGLENEIDGLRRGFHKMEGCTISAVVDPAKKDGACRNAADEVIAEDETCEGEACEEVVMRHAWSAVCKEDNTAICDDGSGGMHL